MRNLYKAGLSLLAATMLSGSVVAQSLENKLSGWTVNHSFVHNTAGTLNFGLSETKLRDEKTGTEFSGDVYRVVNFGSKNNYTFGVIYEKVRVPLDDEVSTFVGAGISFEPYALLESNIPVASVHNGDIKSESATARGSLVMMTTSVRYGVADDNRALYGIFGVHIPIGGFTVRQANGQEKDLDCNGFATIGFGYKHHLGEKFSLRLEYGYCIFTPKTNDRLSIGVAISP